MRPDAVRAVGGLDLAYHTTHASLLDLAYRLLLAGARVAHMPHLIRAAPPRAKSTTIPLSDEIVFSLRHFGFKAGLYSLAWRGVIERDSQIPVAALDAVRRTQTVAPPIRPSISDQRAFRLVGSSRTQAVGSVSAIVPTYRRPEYLRRTLNALLQQSHPLDEVIVVDQTPVEERDSSYWGMLGGSRVRWFHLSRPGQCTARNLGIREATGNWCLFVDDDEEPWPDMLERHVDGVERSGASVSTGLCLAPWKQPQDVPERLRHHQIANVLATGNALIRRDALLELDGLDPIFDTGPGADHDLGVRLYLAGHEIVYNPLAIITHHKAPEGGLRAHGAWWRNKTAINAPFPPPTQIYTVENYYPRRDWPSYWMWYFLRARRRSTVPEAAVLYATAPFKLVRAMSACERLRQQSSAHRRLG